MPSTSLKLPQDLKSRIAVIAERQGVSPHAFMVEAIRREADQAERRAAFVAEALAARGEAVETGEGFDAADVHEYLRGRVDGAEGPLPKPKSWRG